MTLRIHPVPGKAKSDMICKAFLAGAPKSAVGSVFFGTEGQMTAFERAKACGEPWFYIDNSYFDKHRGIYFRVTKNALQVDPRGKTSDGKRFEALKIAVKPAREKLGEKVILVPQSDQFMKSIGYCYVGGWTQDAIRSLSQLGICDGIEVHPWQRDKIARGEAFAAKLDSARLVVTHSSAAAITALLEGVPAVSMGVSAAAHWIGWGKLSQVAPQAERLTFAQVLADNQFTLEEMRSGKAWALLK